MHQIDLSLYLAATSVPSFPKTTCVVEDCQYLSSVLYPKILQAHLVKSIFSSNQIEKLLQISFAIHFSKSGMLSMVFILWHTISCQFLLFFLIFLVIQVIYIYSSRFKVSHTYIITSEYSIIKDWIKFSKAIFSLYISFCQSKISFFKLSISFFRLSFLLINQFLNPSSISYSCYLDNVSILVHTSQYSFYKLYTSEKFCKVSPNPGVSINQN
ncbi:hypothetical protein PPERSA_04722 [Pseudocohnilembus persalinus]|uniref:Transmembrane protein n=1 Tax=Pseudocohnilembus persalinus TaxID=266149 RepID=A0A0V0R5D6_PSEPJ|nr:hypothetical protein PPERSA_04722 [Pseudocohnilembus persalinus]|eukprot:KRX09416.1 hypothetical protein PPERSA_04722 [Pseudocohnilembus persalinus]